jgi:hypothetical protein
MGMNLRLAITIQEQRDDKGAIVAPAAAYSSQLAWTDATISYDEASGRQLFCPDYDFRRAWLCWQRARSIAPTHPVLEAVAAYERKLEADHPEYFRIGYIP